MNLKGVVLFGLSIHLFALCLAAPMVIEKEVQPRQLQFRYNPDGTISGAYSFAEAINAPGTSGSIGAVETFNIGPQGSSFGGSESTALNSDIAGTVFGFGQSNAQSSSQNLNRFSSANANAEADNFKNSYFSNGHANAFANQFNNQRIG